MTAPRIVQEQNEWMQRGACNDADGDLFFPDENQGGPKAYDEALKYCRSCPVQSDCLNHALDTPERDGMWGGATPRARREIRARRRAMR